MREQLRFIGLSLIAALATSGCARWSASTTPLFLAVVIMLAALTLALSAGAQSGPTRSFNNI
jgi:hypothetical protein